MNEDINRKRIPLSPEQRKRIFNEEVLPSLLTGDRPPTSKSFVGICCEQGGGKSTMVQAMENYFKGERTISLSMDNLRNSLPGHNEARMKGAGQGLFPHEAATLKEWSGMAWNYALKDNSHIILESVNDPRVHNEHLDKYHYNDRQVYFIATNKEVSFTAMFSRAVKGFQKGQMANCAILDRQSHEKYYAKWANIAYEIEREGDFNKVGVATRDGEIFYENDIVGHTQQGPEWRLGREAHKQIIHLKNRPFTQTKIDQLKVDWQDILHGPLADHPEFKRHPLQKYRDDIMSHVESRGARFDPKLALPRDRTEDGKSYLNLLDKDLTLMEKGLDMKIESDFLFSTDLNRIHEDASYRTERAVALGNRLKRDNDERVAAEKARQAAVTQRSAGSPSNRAAGDSTYGSLTAEQVRRLGQNEANAPGAPGDRHPIKRLRSDASDHESLEAIQSDSEKVATEAMLALGGPQAKRARTSYDERPRDGGGRA